MPAARLRDVSWGLVRVVRRKERRNLGIAEEVAQPGACWKVIDDLGSLLLSIRPGKPPICTADITACSVAVLVVRELVMLTVDESYAVVGARLDLDHATFADFFEEPLGQGPGPSVVVGG